MKACYAFSPLQAGKFWGPHSGRGKPFLLIYISKIVLCFQPAAGGKKIDRCLLQVSIYFPSHRGGFFGRNLGEIPHPRRGIVWKVIPPRGGKFLEGIGEGGIPPCRRGKKHWCHSVLGASTYGPLNATIYDPWRQYKRHSFGASTYIGGSTLVFVQFKHQSVGGVYCISLFFLHFVSTFQKF